MKITRKAILFIATALSYLLTILYSLFVLFCTPRSFWESPTASPEAAIVYRVLAVLALMNELGVLLSLFVSLKECWLIIKKNKFEKKQLGTIALGLCPIFCVCNLFSWNFSNMVQGSLFPFRILFNF